MGFTMYSALYYPHIQVKGEELVKTALLLWDQLKFIAPFAEWAQHSDDYWLQEAFQLIAKPHVPVMS